MPSAEMEEQPMDIDPVEEEDEIESTYDVYISQSLAEKLYQLQYPSLIHKSSSNIGRIKPNARQIELSIPIKQQYDDPYELGTSIPFRSFYHENSSTSLVGVVHAGNQIHLTPINSTLQLSPNLAHYDKYHEKPTEEKTAADIKPDKIIQMSLKKNEDIDVKEIDQAERRKQFAMEHWGKLNVFNENCIESQDLIHSLYSCSEAELSCVSSPKEYLDMLSPKLSIVPADISGKAREQYLLPRTGRLNNDVKGLGLDAIIENLMVNAYILPYSEILRVIDSSHHSSAEKITVALSRCAFLVRGVWILQSRYQYTPGSRVFNSREYLLYLFSKGEYVSRAEFTGVCRLLPLMCKQMLGEIAQLVGGKGWRLKWGADDAYCRRFPQVVDFHGAEMVRIGGVAEKALKVLVIGGVSKSEAKGAKAAGGGRSTAGPVTKMVGLMDMNLNGKTEDDQVVDMIKDLCKAHCSISLAFCMDAVKMRCRSEVDGNLLYGKQVEEDTLKELMQRVCVHMHGVFVAKLVNDKDIDKFRVHVLEVFRVKNGRKKSEILAACFKGAGEDCPAGLYLKIIKEIATSKGPVWQIKASPASSEE